MKRAVVYSPYWNTLGGGEKYLAVAAKVLSTHGYRVEIYWNDQSLLDKLEKRFGLSMSGITVNASGYEVVKYGNWLHKTQAMRHIDLVLMVSDGSVPAMFGGKNILHFQVPFHDVNGASWLNRLKFRTIDTVVCNSRFTKKVIDNEFGIESQVVYPPSEIISSKKKLPLILSVGRFDNLLHAKKQDVLIQAFESMRPKKWRLVIAGGLHSGNRSVEDIEAMSTHPDIKFVINPSWKELVHYFSQASVYWHATGFGEDLNLYPEKAEHFGISVVEAMSTGAVPVIFDGGGLVEIVKHHTNGFLWSTQQELVQFTQKLINDPVLMRQLSRRAIESSHQFSVEAFEKEFVTLIS